nr:IS1595 family transposase [Nostoc sp. ChiQUE02]MDZ8231274.1 IS1595 family transposase [Nostoc sp. ChiQUE02]
MERTEEECLKYLEQICWGEMPTCPYCESTNSTSIKREHRYHCNTCFNSYSVTVNTIFHRSHVPLNKWFKLVHLYLISDSRLSIRKVAQEISVTKNTAMSMLSRLDKEVLQNPGLLTQISNFWRY